MLVITTCILLAYILFNWFSVFSLQSLVRKTIKSIDFNITVALPVMVNVVIYVNMG